MQHSSKRRTRARTGVGSCKPLRPDSARARFSTLHSPLWVPRQSARWHAVEQYATARQPLQARTAGTVDGGDGDGDGDGDDRHQLHVVGRCALSGITTSGSLNVAIRSPGAKAREARRPRPRVLVPLDRVRVGGIEGMVALGR